MKNVSLAWVLLLMATLIGLAAEPQKDAQPPEQKAYFSWMKAIKEQDLETFKASYSKRMKEAIAKHGWRESIEKYKKELDERFGDYKPEDFTFTFHPGQNNEGTLRVTFKGTQQSLKLLKEDDSWKIDEY